MSLLEILFLALALSMDAFAVAIAIGIRCCVVSQAQIWRLSFSFGFFQFLMPVIGWYLGSSVRAYIEAWDHWLAFALLAFVGGKMIVEAVRPGEEAASCPDPTRGGSLLMLSLATSLDALAVGLSLAFAGRPIGAAALGIGIICALLTFAGLRLGCMVSSGSRIGPHATLAGGVVLIGIGLRILYEHGGFTQLAQLIAA